MVNKKNVPLNFRARFCITNPPHHLQDDKGR